MTGSIVALYGSLREGSLNRRLAHACIELLPAGWRLDVSGIDGIPLYDGDVEAREGIPSAVQALKERIVGASALLIVTPEYNNGIPGPLKNAIDWLSRPPADSARVFGGRPVGVIGASPGRYGTLSSQQAWLPVLRALQTVPYFGHLVMVGTATTVFGPDGRLTDPGTRERLQAYLEGYTRFVARQRG